MNILHALILGLVQGLCEFLPVSSSGHLVLAQRVLGISQASLLFDTFLHVGTLAAVFAVYFKDIWEMIKRPLSKPVYCLAIATVPAVIFALIFGDFFDDIFAGRFLGISFIITSGILFLSSRFSGERREVSYRDAAMMGLWQGVAILPGISRSGATISGGLMQGLRREDAAKFSFLMSIPAILGSVVYQFKDIVSGAELGAIGAPAVIVGILASAVSGYAAIRFMLRVLQRASLKSFAWYTLALGALVLCDQLFFNVFFVPMF
jgi:undecaprenyl-diphosphatase